MKKCLVIGANGFLGRHLCTALLNRGFFVTGTYHDKTNNLPEHVATVSIEVALESLESIVYNVVYITSAYIPKEVNETNLKSLYDTNVSLIEKICNANPLSKIVYCSTIAVYGNSSRINTSNTPPSPNSEYGISKLWGEFIVRKNKYYAILRFSSLFGIGMYEGTFLPTIIRNALNENKITLYGDGTRVQNYLGIHDAVDYLIAAGNSKTNNIFLATHPVSYTNTEMAQMVLDNFTGATLNFSGNDDSPSFYCENSRTRNELNIIEHQPTSESIKELVQWIRK